MRNLRNFTTESAKRSTFGVVAVAAVLAMSGCVADGAQRAERHLDEPFASAPIAEALVSDNSTLLTTQDATNEYCTDGALCIEAASNAYFSILKFEDEGAAQNYLDSIGENAYLFDHFVLQFDGTEPVTEDERETVLNAFTIAEQHVQD